METKRKDNKGRTLREGESQRKNGSYCYRYFDQNKKRKSIYANTLQSLREKESKIKRDMAANPESYDDETTVGALIDRYFSLKRKLKAHSIDNYTRAIKKIHDDPFGKLKICSIRVSDAKSWYISLHEKGYKRNTIGIIDNILKPAFDMAVSDDLIKKNPFNFGLASLLPDDSAGRVALTEEQQKAYLEFAKQDGKCYNEIAILLGTGMRIGELYGLTLSDIDFESRRISVNKQLMYVKIGDHCERCISEPKSKSGIRTIPMTNAVYDALCSAIESRRNIKNEPVIAGYSGFIFISRKGKPHNAKHLEYYMRKIQPQIEKQFGGNFPKTTPHVLRHTFCTNAQKRGLDIKSLQYIMGHSSISPTLNIYSHADYEHIEKAFARFAV